MSLVTIGCMLHKPGAMYLQKPIYKKYGCWLSFQLVLWYCYGTYYQPQQRSLTLPQSWWSIESLLLRLQMSSLLSRNKNFPKRTVPLRCSNYLLKVLNLLTGKAQNLLTAIRGGFFSFVSFEGSYGSKQNLQPATQQPLLAAFSMLAPQAVNSCLRGLIVTGQGGTVLNWDREGLG